MNTNETMQTMSDDMQEISDSMAEARPVSMAEAMQEKAGIHGAITTILEKGTGEVEVQHKDNLITNAGFDFICDVIGNNTQPGDMTHIGVGTGTTAAAATQTALVTQLLRKVCTYAHTAGTKVFTMTVTFVPGEATGAITEAGVFNAATAGSMLDRVVFPVVNKGADDTLTCVFTFTLS